MPPSSGRPLVLATAGVFFFGAILCACTCGDFGLTWDEPVYRQSQRRAEIWFENLLAARSVDDAARLFDAQTLHYYWVYGRFGINFHPPLAGMLNLAAYEILGGIMQDIPARRMGAVVAFAGAVALLFHAMSRRHGTWVGLVSAGCLFLTPRVFADGQIGATDAPGLLFWPATALAFWAGMYEPGARPARIMTGVCLGLAFLVKPVATMVVLPLILWYAASTLRPSRLKTRSLADFADAALTLAPMFAVLGIALVEMRRLAAAMPPPRLVDLYTPLVATRLPDWWLGLPFAYWLIRRAAARLFRRSSVLGRERPALETLAAALGIAPLLVWLGNPAWWLMSIPRLAHYYGVGADRRSALPPMPVMFFGQSYIYASPWESAWVWLAVTTPLTILAVELIGIVVGLSRSRVDKLPLFFLLNAAVLPFLRVFSIPGHDGTRLLLPSFFFLAAFGGWGALALTKLGARFPAKVIRSVTAAAVLLPAAFSLVRVHPFEMSYYNAILGGPVGAWRKGLELSYWYDALTPWALKEIDEILPPSAQLVIVNGLSIPYDYMETLQSLGKLRPDLRFRSPELTDLPYMLLLTADAKTDAISRVLFALKPTWALEPAGLDGARVISVYGPRAVALGFCLQVMTDVLPGRGVPPKPAPKAPEFVRRRLPFLVRFWGDLDGDVPPLGVNESIFEWARTNPDSLRAAAEIVSKADPKAVALADRDAQRFLDEIRRLDAVNWSYSHKVREACPWALPLAVDLLIKHREELRSVMLRRAYTDPATLGGYLDRDLAPETARPSN